MQSVVGRDDGRGKDERDELDVNESDHPAFDRPSRGQLKREAQARQELGERLCGLNEKQLAQFDLDDILLEAIRLFKRITKGEARRRQLQYIGRLMGAVDVEAVRRGVHEIDHSRRADTDRFQECERWRDRIVAEEDPAINEFVAAFPTADRQRLRQLARNARREADMGKPPASARLIFAMVRDLVKPR